MNGNSARSFPDGISASHLDENGGSRVSWYRTMFVGGFLALALLGTLGGARPQDFRAQTGAVDLRAHIPNPIRNGMLVEWQIAAKARRPIGDVVVAIPAGLWSDMTINSLVPAATEERFKDGAFLFHFGPLDAGEELLFKIDGQINPPRLRRQQGVIRLYDGGRELAALPIDLRVVP